jgi:hypothetical protein
MGFRWLFSILIEIIEESKDIYNQKVCSSKSFNDVSQKYWVNKRKFGNYIQWCKRRYIKFNKRSNR